VGLAGATKKRKTFAEKATKLDFVSSSQATREEQPLPVGYIPTPSHTLHQRRMIVRKKNTLQLRQIIALQMKRR